MQYFEQSFISKLALLVGLVFIFAACEEENGIDISNLEPGVVEAEVSKLSVSNSETVTFTDLSTKVSSRTWTFTGGNPASSTDSIVTVSYAYGGTWEATLSIQHVDNTTGSKTFQIEVDGPAAPQSLPYTGTAVSIPGTIEAEDYNLGAQGLAYFDTDEGNNAITAGSAVYRTDNDAEGNVDVQVNDPGVTNIGWTAGGEWLNYSVNVASAGTHTIEFVLASDLGLASVQLSRISGEDTTFLAESGDAPSTGGWGTYESFKIAANLEAGEQLWHLYFTGGATNLDKIVVSEGEPVIDAKVDAEASTLIINAGETVTFTDNSTLVDTRSWTFEGGNPATSSDAEVIVTYATPGTYAATIDINHTDGTSGSQTFEIVVRDPNADLKPLAFYTERTDLDDSNPNDRDRPSPTNSSNFNLSYVTDAAEGSEAIYADFDPGNTGNDQTWGAMVSMYAQTSPMDLSAYNYYNISLKVPAENTKNLRIRLRTSAGNFWVTLSDQYGFLRDGEWHSLKIPFEDLLNNGNGDGLGSERAEVTEVIFRSDDADWDIEANFDWYIDDIYFSVD
ncbi:MAG: carbohydrate-binding protein [Marinoscillum sp.]